MGWMQRLSTWLVGSEVKASGSVSTGTPLTYVGANQDGRAATSEWSGDKAVQDGLKVNTWVYSGSSKISTGLASVPLVLERLQQDQWAADPAHPIQQLLDRPNPHMARQDITERWALHMLLAGNALWWLNIVAGKPSELWPFNPDEIKPLKSRRDFIGGYEWKPAGQDKQTLPREAVAHWMFVNPADVYWGLSPIMAAARAVDTDITASAWNRAVLANDGAPPYAVLLNDSLSVEQQRAATALLRDQLDGRNVRRMMALGAARDIKSIAMNAKDLDWLNGRRFSREEIGAVLGVPPILMAFGEAATYANLDAAKTILWEDRIVPMLDDLCSGLQMALFPFWNLVAGQWRIRADLSGVRALQSNLKTEAEVGFIRSQTLVQLVSAGVPVNMAARYLDLALPEIEGGDAPRGPAMPAAKSRAGPTLERKDKAIDQRQGRMDGWEGKVKTQVADLLKAQGENVAAAYVADGTLPRDLGADDWQALLEAVHTAVVESEGQVAYSGLLKSITVNNRGGVFDVLDPAVKTYIQDRAGDMAKDLTDTTRAGLRSVLGRAVDEGLGQSETAALLKGQFADWSDARAQLVARTEVTNAFSAAHQLSAEQLSAEHDVELVKTWRSAEDSRTRPEHAAMDGETVGLKDSFSNGLDSPGEPNCRCVVTYDERGP